VTNQGEPTQPGGTGRADHLSARIGTWTADLAEAAASFGLTAVAELCVDVDAERHRRSFRVAVVGEFNRGKSSIVNQLLGVTVMPVGPLALTEGLVSARGSSSPCIEIERADGQRSRLPLSLDSWSAVGQGDQVTAWVDSAWLRDGSIELVDTAGTNTTAADARGPARRAVRRADATLMCVSAIQPLAETERQFLAGEVLRRRIPHVVVALTMADRIGEVATREVVGKLHADLEAFGGPRLVVSPGVDTAAAAQLRQILTEMAARPGRALSRSPVLATVLLDAAEMCAAAAETGQALREQDAAEQARVLGTLRQDLPGTSAQWDTLLAEFEVRGRELLSSLLQALSQECDDLVNRYLSELRITQDPLTWWNEVLDSRAGADLRNQAAQCTARLRGGVEQDVAWLEREAAERFGFRATARRMPVAAQQTAFTHPRVPLTDTAATRRRTRLAGGAGALLAAAVAAATGVVGTVVFSAGGGLAGNVAGQRILRRINEQNVSEARPLLTAAMNDSVEQLADNLSALMPVLYQDLGESFRNMALAAQDARIRAAQAEMAARSQPAPDWDRLAETAERVANEINAALRP
jgi:hypothetical protein